MHQFRVLVLVAIVSAIAISPATAHPSVDVTVAGNSADEVESSELQKLQGNWEPVSAVYDGKVVKIDEKSVLSYVLEGRTLSVRREGKEVGKVEIKHIVAKDSFGHMDFERTEDNGRAVTGEGRAKMLYKLEGGTLTICLGLVGADRPSEFASKPGSNVRLSVLKIKKK